MANRWEAFSGCSSTLLDMLDNISDDIKIKYKDGDKVEDAIKEFEEQTASLEQGLADIEKDESLADILTPQERNELAKILKHDASFNSGFSAEEKLILYTLIGEKPPFQVIADVIGKSVPGTKKIFDRAMEKIVDLQKKEGKEYIEALKLAFYNKKAAMADGRYQHKGNVRGMERPGWKDSEKNPANQTDGAQE